MVKSESRDKDQTVTFFPVLISWKGKREGRILLGVNRDSQLPPNPRLVTLGDVESLVISESLVASRGRSGFFSLSRGDRDSLRFLVAVADLVRAVDYSEAGVREAWKRYDKSLEAFLDQEVVEENSTVTSTERWESEFEDPEEESVVTKDPALYFAQSMAWYLSRCELVIWEPPNQLTPMPALLAESPMVACALVIMNRLGASENIAKCQRRGCGVWFMRKKSSELFHSHKCRQNEAKARQRDRERAKLKGVHGTKKTR